MGIFKVSEWLSAAKRWYVADTTTFSKWWIIPRFLNMSLEEYILLLKNTYHASHFKYDFAKNTLIFSWAEKDYTYAHKYMLWVNRMAKNHSWSI